MYRCLVINLEMAQNIAAEGEGQMEMMRAYFEWKS
jgi:hypothetical protein